MKLLSFEVEDTKKVGYLKEKVVYELPMSMEEALISDNLEEKQIGSYSVMEVNILPPIIPSKVVCVGLNYERHAIELGLKIPEEPTLFIKPSSSVIGHRDKVIYPATSKQLDYEAELAVVMSKKARFITHDEVDEYIGGYTILNDVTARDLQTKDGQWTRSKSFDTFCPIGPVIETDLDPDNQEITLKCNGEIKQSDTTSRMIFSARDLIVYISSIMTLNPGDIIATGTPMGVGYFKPNSIVRIKISGIGVLENQAISYQY